jgi:hypothetical protein
MFVYRSMIEASDGLPLAGASGRKLGVRPANLPNPDVGAAADGDLIHPGTGGMSVAPSDPSRLPKHRRPRSLGGTGTDPVWRLDLERLTSLLQFRQDKPTHGLIEPASVMTLREFQDALAATRNEWVLHAR